MAFDPSKPVQTRGGVRATILTATRNHRDNIVGLIHRANGDDVFIFGPDGSVSKDGPSQNDLVNIPESKWMNLYRTEGGLPTAMQFWRSSRQQADEVSTEGCNQRVAVVEWTAAGEFIITKVDK